MQYDNDRSLDMVHIFYNSDYYNIKKGVVGNGRSLDMAYIFRNNDYNIRKRREVGKWNF